MSNQVNRNYTRRYTPAITNQYSNALTSSLGNYVPEGFSYDICNGRSAIYNLDPPYLNIYTAAHDADLTFQPITFNNGAGLNDPTQFHCQSSGTYHIQGQFAIQANSTTVLAGQTAEFAVFLQKTQLDATNVNVSQANHTFLATDQVVTVPFSYTGYFYAGEIFMVITQMTKTPATLSVTGDIIHWTQVAQNLPALPPTYTAKGDCSILITKL